MCYFVKLVFSGKKIDELNLNLSLENTFLKVPLFKITDYPPHCRDSALGPGQVRSLGWLREVCTGTLLLPLAFPWLTPGCPQVCPCGGLCSTLSAQCTAVRWPELRTHTGISLLRLLGFLWLRLSSLNYTSLNCTGWISAQKMLRNLHSPQGMWCLCSSGCSR